MVLASNCLKSNDLKDNFLHSSFSILYSETGCTGFEPALTRLRAEWLNRLPNTPEKQI